VAGANPADVGPVDDSEILYRRAAWRNGVRPYAVPLKGDKVPAVRPGLRVPQMVFADKRGEPSVDRAKFGFGPSFTQGHEDNGVLQVRAGELRGHKLDLAEGISARLEVRAAPLPENPSHAVVVLEPAITTLEPQPTRSALTRMKGRFEYSLCQKWTWLILPSGVVCCGEHECGKAREVDPARQVGREETRRHFVNEGWLETDDGWRCPICRAR
jgi:hypothetical protein